MMRAMCVLYGEDKDIDSKLIDDTSLPCMWKPQTACSLTIDSNGAVREAGRK